MVLQQMIAAMGRRWLWLLIACLCCAPAAAQKRFALVIGINDYSGSFSTLHNSSNDARAIAEVLQSKAGFEVTLLTNATREQLYQARLAFEQRLKDNPGSDALLYFSGHGLQGPKGTNYLVPKDAKIAYYEDLDEYGLSVAKLLEDVTSAGPKTTIFIIDACRNGVRLQTRHKGAPFKGTMSAMDSGENSLLAFATSAETYALDYANDGDAHSPYTAALLENLTTPGDSIETVFKKTRAKVMEMTHGQQQPKEETGLTGDFYFVSPPPIPANATPAAKPADVEAESIKPARLPFEPEMVAISAQGKCFQMGSPDTEKERDSDERQHQVCFDKDYQIGRTEVTQAQWWAVMGSDPPDLGFKNCGDDCPVESVSWDEVQTFIARLNEKTGGGYRLPTEAEWEYAAGTINVEAMRGFTVAYGASEFYTGHCISTTQANYDGNYDYADCGAKTGVYKTKTMPVGSYSANSWGLYDMAGNVWEWTCSGYDKDYQGGENQCISKNDANTPRVLRGGSWNSFPRWLRSAARFWITPDYRSTNVGFRLARM